MLCKFACLTQRETAGVMKLKSGVSCQLSKLRNAIEDSEELKIQIEAIAEKLELLHEKG